MPLSTRISTQRLKARAQMVTALDALAECDQPRSIPKDLKQIDLQLQKVCSEAAILAGWLGEEDLVRKLEIASMRCRTCGY